jgi:hypothetical protein
MIGLFGFWTLEKGEAGSKDPHSSGDTLVWRVDLPTDPALASALLDQAESSLALTRTAITAAEGRIHALLENHPEMANPSAGGSVADHPQPEAALLSLLAAAGTDGPAGFEGLDPRAEGWHTAADEFQAFIAWVEASLSKDSRVETRIEGQLIAQTRLSQLGDLETTWLDQAGDDQRTGHQRSLQAALAGLQLMVLALAGTARLASRLSGLIENSESGLLALPTAWWFTNQIYQERQP